MIKDTLKTATTAERKASRQARHGDRYYPIDESYDKRVYENTPLNYAKIVTCLVIFWIFQAFHWWGILSLGIVATDALIWYSIGCFLFTVFFLAGLLFSGKYANAKKREITFYKDIIAQKITEKQEIQTKKDQDAAHQAKLSQQAEKLAKDKRAAEAAELERQEAAGNEMTGVQQRETVGGNMAINSDAPQRDGRLIGENRA